MITKQITSFTYTDENKSWQVQTDYLNDKIYIDAPDDDADLRTFKEFGVAIGRAVKDMKGHKKHNENRSEKQN